MKIRTVLGCVALLGAMTLLAGCPPPPDSGSGGGGGTSANGGSSGGDGGGSSAGSILVGFYGDMTGNTATFGTSTRNGIDMAVEEINRDPPLGKKLEIRGEDDQGKPEQANSAVTKLITQDNVVAVIGEIASTRSRAAAPVCQREKVPMISPASTNPAVTEVGDYIFRICFIDPFQGSVMAKFAYNNLKKKRAAILTDVKNDYSTGLTKFFEETYTGLGGQVVAKQSYSEGDTTFTAQLSSIKAANPDVLFIPGYYNEVGTIARQARDLGLSIPLIGGDGWDSEKLFESSGNALKGGFFSNHYATDSKDPRVVEFIKKYKAKYSGKLPDAMAALGYDSTKILAEAIKRAGSTDGLALRDAIAKTKDFPGVTGTITINEQRNATKPAVVLEIGDDSYKYVDTIQP
jgi:branched-chain amino acid transport system substrate-binding protein